MQERGKMIKLDLRMRVEKMRNEKGKGIFKAIQLPLSLTLLLILLLVSGLALTQASATVNVSIGDLTCAPGATVTAPILIANVENYGTGTINLEYNPSVVHVTDVTSGPQSTLAAPPNIDNTSGIVNISALNLAGISGDVIFANVTFKAVGSAGSSTPLNLSVITLYKLPDYEDIPVIIKNGSFSILSPPTPFFIYGYVFYESGSECHNPEVNVTNLNASNVWNAETKEGYNYYQLILSQGIDINTSEVLQFNATSCPDGSQSNITEHTVIQDEINNGGLFNFNITLGALAAHDINVSTDYTGTVDGVRIDNETGETIPADQILIIEEKYYIKYKIVNGGDFNESVNITVSVSNATGWNQTIKTRNWNLKVGKSRANSGGDEWDTSGLSPGNYNITVNASIPVDDDWSNNERTRQVTLVLPDLVITDKFETLEDGNFTVNYTVKNIGAGDAAASNMTIYIDGINVLEDPVPALVSGENYTNTVGPFECPCGQTLNVTVCADNGNAVDESDETNNCMINMFVCPPCPCVPVIEVNKTVWNGTAWVETIPDAEINNTYRFRCEVHNNGTCCDLTNIKVADNLSDSLKYANNATVDGVPREPDWITGNKFEWDFTGPLAPCETVVLEFDATVIDCGNDSNVQNATAYCPETEKWVSGEDDAWINVPDGTDCGEDYYDPWVTYCKGDEVWKNRTFHDFYCDGGECVDHTSIVDDQFAENCSEKYGEWEDDPEDPCKERRLLYECINGTCVEDGYEYRDKIIPDLVITEKYETLEDGNFTVNYTIKNIGGGDAGACNTAIYINGTNVLEDPVPALAPDENYTNTVGPFECLCSETLNVTVCADNGNAVEESDETNNCMVNEFTCSPCSGAPNITYFAPPSPVTNNESESRAFNITINQTVNVSWLINGTEVFNQSSVNFSEYTNSSAVAGYWNVTAYVYNANGSDIQTWWWTVKDITPPASVTNLQNITYAQTYINWTWDDPVDPDFSHVMVFIDGRFKENVTKGMQYYNAPGFDIDTEHTISSRTVDTSGNVNQSWVNHTARTAPDTMPPEVVGYAPTGTNVPVTTNVTATFSEAVNESTLNNETIKVKSSTGIRIEGIITYDSDNFTATFDPLSNLEYSETYNVTITTGVQDIAENNMSFNFTWNFTTWEPDLVISGQWVNWPENCTICYNITNIGNGTVLAGHNTTLYVDSNEPAHDEVPVNLAPNESYIGCFNYTWRYTPPEDNITVCADNNNTVHESNESNNCLTSMHKCGDVDETGIVTLWDVSLTWQDAYRTPTNGWAEDVDCNGYVTIWDMSLLWQAVKYGSWNSIECCCTEMEG